MTTSVGESARRSLRVRQSEAVVVELLVTATRAAEAGLRQWADQQGLDVDHAAHQEAGCGLLSLHLRQVRVLEGRASSSVSEGVVATWAEALRHRSGVSVVSYQSKAQSRSTWKKVLARDDHIPLEFVLVPEKQLEPETLSQAGERLGRPASELRLKDSWSWSLRSSYSRFLSTCLLVILLVGLAWLIALVLPSLRSTGLLLGGVLLATCGLAFLVKDQGARAIGAQLALLLGGLATVSYAACRWAYYVYYDDFGTTPEEVGLDYRTILSNQPLFVVSVVLIVLVVALSCYAFAAALNQFSDTTQQKVASLVALIIVVGGSAALVPLVSITRDAHRAAEAVRGGGNPSTGSPFFWPDPRRVALATASPATPGTAQVAYSATLAGGDLRLLGGDSSVWSVVDSVTGSTFRLPKVAAPLVLAPSGINRLVTLTGQGVRPVQVRLPPDMAQEVAVYNESGLTCTSAAGPYQTHRSGQLTVLDVTVPAARHVDVLFNCVSSNGGLAADRTLELRTGQE